MDHSAVSYSHEAALADRPGFQEPRLISDPLQCYFYHTIDLPGLGTMLGEWDLRADIEAYLGNQNFRGKRVLDVGTASGCLCFEMERRGATVVAFDRFLNDPKNTYGLIPYSDFRERFGRSLPECVGLRRESHLRLQNSFWLAHRLLGSRSQLYCGQAYDCPEELGEFDYTFFGCILLHLRDPLGALSAFADQTREKIIITETFEEVGPAADLPVLFLRANRNDAGNAGTWWYLTPTVLTQYLQVLGFSDCKLSFHQALSVPAQRNAKLFTLVATRGTTK